MSKNVARLSANLYVDCPACDATLDLFDADDDQLASTAIFSNKWEDLKGEEYTCPDCYHEFKIDDVEY
jgi:DNA-directed RNA polymerase subunit RPC12/RpoP